MTGAPGPSNVAGAALILALTVLVIRYGHIRFPYEHVDEDHHR